MSIFTLYSSRSPPTAFPTRDEDCSLRQYHDPCPYRIKAAFTYAVLVVTRLAICELMGFRRDEMEKTYPQWNRDLRCYKSNCASEKTVARNARGRTSDVRIDDVCQGARVHSTKPEY